MLVVDFQLSGVTRWVGFATCDSQSYGLGFWLSLPARGD